MMSFFVLPSLSTASEVTTIWHDMNLLIIVIIVVLAQLI